MTQINPGDVWHRGMRAYDPEGRPLPRPVDRRHAQGLHDRARRQAGDGGRRRLQERRLLRPERGRRQDPGPHARSTRASRRYPLDPPPDSRMLALPGPLGGLQTGCATDGKSVFTNGIDALLLGTQETEAGSMSAADRGPRRVHQRGHPDRALAARTAQGRAGREALASCSSRTSATRSRRASRSPTASSTSRRR